MPPKKLFDLAQDKAGDYFALGYFDVFKVDINQKEIDRLPIDGLNQLVNEDSWLLRFLIDREDNMWLGSNWAGLGKFNLEQQTFKKNSHPTTTPAVSSGTWESQYNFWLF